MKGSDGSHLIWMQVNSCEQCSSTDSQSSSFLTTITIMGYLRGGQISASMLLRSLMCFFPPDMKLTCACACSAAEQMPGGQAMPSHAGAEQEASQLKMYTLSTRLEMYVDQAVWHALTRQDAVASSSQPFYTRRLCSLLVVTSLLTMQVTLKFLPMCKTPAGLVANRKRRSGLVWRDDTSDAVSKLAVTMQGHTVVVKHVVQNHRERLAEV